MYSLILVFLFSWSEGGRRGSCVRGLWGVAARGVVGGLVSLAKPIILFNRPPQTTPKKKERNTRTARTRVNENQAAGV